MKSGGIHPAKPMEDKKKDKETKMKEQKELAMLFKPVQTQKVEKGNTIGNSLQTIIIRVRIT